MFRTLIHPSLGACDFSIVSPHWLCVLVSMCVGVSVWLIEVVSVWQASTCNTDTTPTQPHRNSSTHRTKNNTTIVVIQQNSRKLLMMDILMSETCWAHKKWNKITSDIKLVSYSSTIAFLDLLILLISDEELNLWSSTFLQLTPTVWCFRLLKSKYSHQRLFLL